MSPRQRVTRQGWVDATMRLSLDQDRLPAEVSVEALAGELDVTKGSFYSHFREKRQELHAAVISQWFRERVAGLPDIAVGAVQDPLDRVRMIRAAIADTAVRDGAMRRWAASDRAAAEAVAEADQIVTSRLGRALTDLGFAAAESAALTRWLTAALSRRSIAEDQAGFDAVLAVLSRASVAPALDSLATADGIVLYTGGAGLGREEQLALQNVAALLAGRPGRDAVPPVPGQSHASEA